MFGSVSRRLSRVGTYAVAAALALGSVTVFAQAATTTTGDCSDIQFQIANPSPGSHVDAGPIVLQGIAFDARDENGGGIDRVDFFLGDRDQGGFLVGHAVPTAGGPFDATSFSAAVTLPNQPGGHVLFAYAHSAVSGQESIISFPIALGVDPSKAGVIMATPWQATCLTPVPPADMSAEPAPAPEEAAPAMAPAPEAVAAPEEGVATSKMFLDVGNPSPNDSVHVGALMIEGLAFDRASDQMPGIDHIDIFLDDRDTGGTLIGHAAFGVGNPQPDDPSLVGAGWNAHVMISNKMLGSHTMFFYALSAATGEEMVVGIPVQIVQ